MISIQNKSMDIPIIQGGMGVGVSLSSLAGHVANCGGMGVISAGHPGYQKEGFRNNHKETNLIALKEHIQKATEIAKGKGLVGVNIMVAGKGYDDLVNAAIDGGADAIISGAGLPLDLPRLAKNKILMAPIVSSARAIKLILKMWDKKHECTADFVVIEGSEAGGHLGFKVEDLEAKITQSLEEILDEVKEEVTFYEEKYKRKIPLFVAGGINTGKRLKDMILRCTLKSCGSSSIEVDRINLPNLVKRCSSGSNFPFSSTLSDIVLNLITLKILLFFPGRS